MGVLKMDKCSQCKSTEVEIKYLGEWLCKNCWHKKCSREDKINERKEDKQDELKKENNNNTGEFSDWKNIFKGSS